MNNWLNTRLDLVRRDLATGHWSIGQDSVKICSDCWSNFRVSAIVGFLPCTLRNCLICSWYPWIHQLYALWHTQVGYSYNGCLSRMMKSSKCISTTTDISFNLQQHNQGDMGSLNMEETGYLLLKKKKTFFFKHFKYMSKQFFWTLTPILLFFDTIRLWYRANVPTKINICHKTFIYLYYLSVSF